MNLKDSCQSEKMISLALIFKFGMSLKLTKNVAIANQIVKSLWLLEIILWKYNAIQIKTVKWVYSSFSNFSCRINDITLDIKPSMYIKVPY